MTAHHAGSGVPDEGGVQARRILLMLQELHSRRYHRLRICPYIYATGHWRCSITLASNTLRSNGAMTGGSPGAPTAAHTSGWGEACFGWTDTPGKTPGQLAALFVERFPELCRGGFGDDIRYVAWFNRLLAGTAADEVPYAFSDYDDPTDHLRTNHGTIVPLPPPGGAAG